MKIGAHVCEQTKQKSIQCFLCFVVLPPPPKKKNNK